MNWINNKSNVLSIYRIDWLVMFGNKTQEKIIKNVAVFFTSIIFSQICFASSLDYKLEAKQIAKDTYVFEGANDDFSLSLIHISEPTRH